MWWWTRGSLTLNVSKVAFWETWVVSRFRICIEESRVRKVPGKMSQCSDDTLSVLFDATWTSAPGWHNLGLEQVFTPNLTLPLQNIHYIKISISILLPHPPGNNGKPHDYRITCLMSPTYFVQNWNKPRVTLFGGIMLLPMAYWSRTIIVFTHQSVDCLRNPALSSSSNVQWWLESHLLSITRGNHTGLNDQTITGSLLRVDCMENGKQYIFPLETTGGNRNPTRLQPRQTHYIPHKKSYSRQIRLFQSSNIIGYTILFSATPANVCGEVGRKMACFFFKGNQTHGRPCF